MLVMQREQRDEYLGTELNIEKMKKKLFNMGKQYNNAINLLVSFFTRYCTMEQCFGDPNNEEPNLAYSILKSIKKVSDVRLT